MSFFEKLQVIDRRIIYALITLALIIPLINPLGVPLSISDTTQKYFDQVDALKAGDKVVMSLDYSPGGSPDVHPQAVSVAKHLIDKGIKVIMVAFWDAGPMYGEQILKPYLDAGTVTYGTDVANLGYIAGGTTAIRSFGFDVPGTQPNDFHGNPVSSLPIMEGIKDLRDVALVLEFQSGNPGLTEFVQQVQGPLGIKLLSGSVTVSVPNAMPFIDSGQVLGLLQGLRGAAEYELLLGAPGEAAAKMDAQSLGHLVIIAFIAIGNFAYFVAKSGKKA